MTQMVEVTVPMFDVVIGDEIRMNYGSWRAVRDMIFHEGVEPGSKGYVTIVLDRNSYCRPFHQSIVVRRMA